MTTYDNTNRGMLARNDRKERDTHPDYNGSINIEGVEYWLSGWVREGREGTKFEGRKFFSLSVQRKDAPSASSGSAGYAPQPTPAPAPAPRVIHDRAPVPPVPPAPRAAVKTGTAFDDMDSDMPF